MKQQEQRRMILSQHQQDQLLKLTNNKVKELEEELQKIFPNEHIPSPMSFVDVLSNALHNDKPSRLQCTGEMYKMLITKAVAWKVGNYVPFSFQEMGFVCNCIMDKSPNELACTNNEWVNIMDTIEDVAAKWQELIAVVNNPILERYNKMEGAVRNNKPLFIPDSIVS